MAASAGVAAAAPLGPSDLPAVFQCLQSALSHDPSTQKQAEAALREMETRPGFCSCLAVRVTYTLHQFPERRVLGPLAFAAGSRQCSSFHRAARCRSCCIALQPQACLPLRFHPFAAAHGPLGLQEILTSKEADHSARWLAAVHFKNSCNKYWRSRLTGCGPGTAWPSQAPSAARSCPALKLSPPPSAAPCPKRRRRTCEAGCSTWWSSRTSRLQCRCAARAGRCTVPSRRLAVCAGPLRHGCVTTCRTPQ